MPFRIIRNDITKVKADAAKSQNTISVWAKQVVETEADGAPVEDQVQTNEKTL
jgi:hypothetical protein